MTLKKTAELVKSFLSKPNRLVFFFDEGRFGLQPVIGRCWTLTGLRKKLIIKPGYKFFYLYSSVSPHTGEDFTLLMPWVNTNVMNIYLNKMSEFYCDKKIMMIMDQAGWHRSKDLIIPDNIQIEYLPPYSPELNPVEKLWQWLRRHACRNRLFESTENLINVLSTTLKNMSNFELSKLCKCNYLLHYN